MPRVTLGRRVALLGALLGVALSAAFAIALWFIAEDYEHLLISAVLEAEAEQVRASLAAGQVADLPRTPHLHAWLLLDGRPQPADLPPAWTGLAAGIHEEPFDENDGLHVAVFDLDGATLVYSMRLGPVEELEHYIVALSFLVLLAGFGAALLLARWLAGRALRPADVLADAVDALPVTPRATALARELPDDALRRLAAAIDGYQARLLDAARAEQAFFADASHELRSPVASLRGAAEVLMDDPDTPAALRRRLERIDRATEDLGQLLDALLLSGREAPAESESIDVGALLADACAAMLPRAQARGVELSLPPADFALQRVAPRRWLHAAVLNLLRTLIDAGGAAAVRPRLIEDGIEFTLEAPLDALQARSDRGFPLRLVERLCARFGAGLELESGRVVLRLPVTGRERDFADRQAQRRGG